MKIQVALLPAGVALLALAACAGNPPAPTQPAAKPVVTAVAPAPDGKPAKLYTDGYRLVKRDGQDIYCKREDLTGSRTQKIETCYTIEQLQAREQSKERLLRDIDGTPAQTQSSDGMGGRSNTVMGH
ncbi:MAG: hypothetical protein WDO12_11940 [Pseudomonadota bacterium]